MSPKGNTKSERNIQVEYKIKNWGFQICYAYLLMFVVPFLIGSDGDITFSYSIISVGAFFVFLYLLNRYWSAFWKTNKGNKILFVAFSLFLLLTLIYGRKLDECGYLELTEWDRLMAPFVGAPFLAMLLYHIYGLIEKKIPVSDCPQNGMRKKETVISAIFLFVSWGIVLLGVYPGFFVYDAVDEIQEVITRQFTTHHPLFHVLYMGGIVQAGYKLSGSYNTGIFLFSLFQMIIFLVGILYVANKMRVLGMHKIICRGIILFMGLFPVYPMFVLCSCKDSLFALFVLLWVVTTYEWLCNTGKYCKTKWIICSVLMCQLRNNAIYALAVTCVFLLIFCKEYRKNLFIVFVCSIVLTTLFSKGMAGILHADATEHQEMLTVPIQQLARTYHFSREAYSEEELQKLYEYLPQENLERYRPKVSDGVKVGFDNEAYEKDSVGFFKLWMNVGKKAPMSYLNAWFMTSYGYWYPDAMIDVYEGNQVFTFTYGENSYFGFETEQPGTRESKLPGINEFYRKLSLELYKEKLPVVSQLFSPGFMLWTMLFMMVYMVRKRGIRSILPYSLLFWIVATLLLGPTYLPRYVFFLWLTIPFMLGDLCHDCKSSTSEHAS